MGFGETRGGDDRFSAHDEIMHEDRRTEHQWGATVSLISDRHTCARAIRSHADPARPTPATPQSGHHNGATGHHECGIVA